MKLKKQTPLQMFAIFWSALLGSTHPLLAAGPEKFVPFDSSHLIGSPDPLPLTTEIAFPNLTFERPVEFTHAGDGTDRIFVLEQKGVVRVFENRRDADRAGVFLDIQAKVSRDGNEEGLLGLAFHPSYRQNGQFFLYYSAANPRRSVISRFAVSRDDPDRADPADEVILLEIPQPYGNHNGGSIRFGPDGYLYVGLGDGGLAHDPHGNAQNLSTLLGSILRIDVDRRDAPNNYGIPQDNPFVGRADARPEIYAYGLRNVWRLSFDRETGDLWCADVGQDRYEEINRIVPGGNYGWKIREGLHPFEPDAPQTGQTLIDPVAEYFHGEGESVTGGLVYRGTKLPQYRGRYFFGDFESGHVWTTRREGGSWKTEKVAETGLQIAAFGEDSQQEMYLCAFDGRIHRLVPRDIDIAAEAAAFPKTLTQTGLFASVPDHLPAPGVLPYDLNIPFWSDDALKQRFIALPADRSVSFHPRRKWEFPVGTVFVKTFLLPLDQSRPEAPQDLTRLETRLFIHGRDGWAGFTYIWNDEQTEAELIDEAIRKDYPIKTAQGPDTQTWHFPSRTQCMACHTKAVKFVLGWNARQINREFDYPDSGPANQIDVLSRLKAFNSEQTPAASDLEAYPSWVTAIGDRDIPPDELDRHARAWLSVNCIMCHHPDGIAGNVAGKPIDLRYYTPLDQTGIVGRPPGQGQLSPPGSAVLKPGDPRHSELLYRISTREHVPERQMPPLATLRTDRDAIKVLTRWIETR